MEVKTAEVPSKRILNNMRHDTAIFNTPAIKQGNNESPGTLISAPGIQ